MPFVVRPYLRIRLNTIPIVLKSNDINAMVDAFLLRMKYRIGAAKPQTNEPILQIDHHHGCVVKKFDSAEIIPFDTPSVITQKS